jgi:sortase A
MADAVLTLTWQEPVSAAYASLQQNRAGDELDDLESDYDPGDVGFLSPGASEAAKARLLAERFEKTIGKGDPIGRVKIDSIGLDTVLMNGTDTATLQKGPGRYPSTPLPGMGSTTGIAGHRTTYLSPFRKINEVEDGDEIRVELPYAAFTYEVQKHEIVDPSAVEVVDPVGYERVVLTACHPRYSAAQRYVLFGKLKSIDTFAISGEGEWVVL